jgi:hypothetical protein
MGGKVPGALGRTIGTITLLWCGPFLGVTASGCAFGPRVLERTYGPYYESLRHADEEELLRNLVHIRYHEAPGMLSVSSIAAQYELSGQAEARPFFIAPNPSNSNVIFKTFTALLPDVSAMGSNRPTISLVPGDDGEAVRRFLSPMTADTLAFLTQTGWPVSGLLRLWAERINGVPNVDPCDGAACTGVADPARFQRALELLQSAADRELLSIRTAEKITELSGPLPSETATAAAAADAIRQGLELRPRAEGKTWTLVRRERRLIVEVTSGSEQDPELLELEGLLNLLPGRSQYDLVVASGRIPDPLLHPAPPSAELRVTPRSTAQVYVYLANRIEVPPEHIVAGLVRPNSNPDCHESTEGIFAIYTAAGHKPPPNAYLAVKYRGWWYYIDDQDAQSKATFAMILQLSQLDLRRRPPGGGPLLTLPAGR